MRDNGLGNVPSKRGFVLKATDGLPRPYFYSFIRGQLNHVDNKDCAWFTESRDLANAMAADLYLRASVSYFVVEHIHEPPTYAVRCKTRIVTR